MAEEINKSELNEGLSFQNPVVEEGVFSLDDIVPETKEEEEEEKPTEEIVEDIPEEQEEVNEEQEVDLNDTSASIANFLQENELLNNVPDDVDLENFDQEALVKTLKFDRDSLAKEYYEKGAKDRMSQVVDKLSDVSKKVLSYNLSNPNAEDKDIIAYLGSINNTNRITNLDVEKDAETIVREYYKADQWNQDEIDEKIVELVAGDNLKKEATRVKPRLDQKASAIVKAQEEQAALIQKYENDMQETLKGKIEPILQSGKIDDLPLTQEDASFLYQAITNNDTPVNIGGKKVTMGWAEALVRHNKYSDKGDIKNLALGLLVMYKGPDAIKSYYAKQARTKESEKVFKQHKFSNKNKLNAQTPVTQDMEGKVVFNLGSFKE